MQTKAEGEILDTVRVLKFLESKVRNLGEVTLNALQDSLTGLPLSSKGAHCPITKSQLLQFIQKHDDVFDFDGNEVSVKYYSNIRGDDEKVEFSKSACSSSRACGDFNIKSSSISVETADQHDHIDQKQKEGVIKTVNDYFGFIQPTKSLRIQCESNIYFVAKSLRNASIDDVRPGVRVKFDSVILPSTSKTAANKCPEAKNVWVVHDAKETKIASSSTRTGSKSTSSLTSSKLNNSQQDLLFNFNNFDNLSVEKDFHGSQQSLLSDNSENFPSSNNHSARSRRLSSSSTASSRSKADHGDGSGSKTVSGSGVVESLNSNYGHIKINDSLARVFFHKKYFKYDGKYLESLTDVISRGDMVYFEAVPSMKPKNNVRLEARTVWKFKKDEMKLPKSGTNTSENSGITNDKNYIRSRDPEDSEWLEAARMYPKEKSVTSAADEDHDPNPEIDKIDNRDSDETKVTELYNFRCKIRSIIHKQYLDIITEDHGDFLIKIPKANLQKYSEGDEILCDVMVIKDDENVMHRDAVISEKRENDPRDVMMALKFIRDKNLKVSFTPFDDRTHKFIWRIGVPAGIPKNIEVPITKAAGMGIFFLQQTISTIHSRPVDRIVFVVWKGRGVNKFFCGKIELEPPMEGFETPNMPFIGLVLLEHLIVKHLCFCCY